MSGILRISHKNIQKKITYRNTFEINERTFDFIRDLLTSSTKIIFKSEEMSLG